MKANCDGPFSNERAFPFLPLPQVDSGVRRTPSLVAPAKGLFEHADERVRACAVAVQVRIVDRQLQSDGAGIADERAQQADELVLLLDWLARDDRIDWSRAVVDSCSIRTVYGGDQTGPNPTDRAKRGSKRHLI